MKKPRPLMKQMKARECRILIVRSDSIRDDGTKCVQTIATALDNQKAKPNLVNLFIIQSFSYYFLSHPYPNNFTESKNRFFIKKWCSTTKK